MPARDDRNRKTLPSTRAANAILPRAATSPRADPLRLRRGVINLAQSEWRRCQMGTNHIACFGVWRIGSRRQLSRVNRTGATRWHKPYRVQIA